MIMALLAHMFAQGRNNTRLHIEEKQISNVLYPLTLQEEGL